MELADRLEALQERSAQPGGMTDDEAKARFLELLKEGHTRGQAGKLVGRTSTWFRRRCNPDGANYDPEFAERYERAAQQNKAQIVDDTFTALVESAKSGNVRAQEKILAAYSEEFSFMRPQAAAGPVNVEQLQVFFGELPLEKLLELKQAREKAKLAELPVITQ